MRLWPSFFGWEDDVLEDPFLDCSFPPVSVVVLYKVSTTTADKKDVAILSLDRNEWSFFLDVRKARDDVCGVFNDAGIRLDVVEGRVAVAKASILDVCRRTTAVEVATASIPIKRLDRFMVDG
jgi:hypothetical protein